MMHHDAGDARPVDDMQVIPVWDPLVRLIHWGLVLMILLNSAVTEEDGLLHQWVGYTACALVAVRLAWGVIGPRPARFSAFPANLGAVGRHVIEMLRGEKVVHLSHNPLGALMVYNLWATVAGLGITGYLMGTLTFYGVEWVEEVHEILFNWLMLSIVLHVVAVLFETWRSGVPLIKSMIDGKKRIPSGNRIE